MVGKKRISGAWIVFLVLLGGCVSGSMKHPKSGEFPADLPKDLPKALKDKFEVKEIVEGVSPSSPSALLLSAASPETSFRTISQVQEKKTRNRKKKGERVPVAAIPF